jgi:hypothetical protein
MKLARLAALALLGAACTSSFADTTTSPLDISSGNALFGRNNAMGNFVDNYTFNLASSSFLTSSVSSSASGAQDLDFTSIVIQNAASVVVASFSGNFGNDMNEFYALSQVQLAPGSYHLMVSGLNSVSQASYAGTMAVTAVPEPASGALIMGGLGLVGFIIRRRRA